MDIAPRYTCNVCGNPGATWIPKSRQRLCKACAAETPTKLSFGEFNDAYWKGGAHVPDSTKREFYDDYLTSSHSFKDYVAATTTKVTG